ncbi:PDZ/DHR/GLGF domain protein [Ancylostoma ceylanicum]|uniref:PDZ/DHR/GLGF domain protein n=1 Tax=Ancylostoma ceylanicum TaxID=53326 RepID=A0A0D6LCU7_9BILA|nr:PDZ/DHR/GLGF domain protein [Ancylostoma ceylanicum]
MWKERFHRDNEVPSPVINRLSPKVFPKFYRSPYLSRKQSLKDGDDTEPPSETSELAALVQSPSQMSEAPIKEEVTEEHMAVVEEAPLDSSVLDSFVMQIIQEAFRDAVLEFVVSNAIPDFKERPAFAKVLSEEHSVASTSHSNPPRTPPQSPVQTSQSPGPSTSGSQLGSPDRHGSPPYTVLRKESESSRSSKTSRKGGFSPSSSRPQSELSNKPNSVCTEEPQTASKDSEGVETPEAKQVARSKFWGEARTVVLQREPNKSFGISIVGGRVEVSQKGGLPGTGNTVSGIFIKSVLPNSPAGRSGMMNMGDRVISVNDIDLREATHEQAVNAIKNATNPVRFVLQSLHSFTPQQHMISSASNSTVGSAPVEISKPEEPPPPAKTESPVHATPQASQSPQREVLAEVVEEETVEQPEEKKEEHPAEEKSVSSRQASQDRPSPTKKQKSQEQNEVESPSKKSVKSVKSVTSEQRRESPQEVQLEKQTSKEPLVKQESMRKRDSLRSEEFRKEFAPSTSSEPATPSSSAAELPKDPDDTEQETKFGYTNGKIQRKYGHLGGTVMLVSCERVPEAGLGISLAGNRDRDKNSTFVLSAKVQCPLTVRAGDELLEVGSVTAYGSDVQLTQGSTYSR